MTTERALASSTAASSGVIVAHRCGRRRRARLPARPAPRRTRRTARCASERFIALHMSSVSSVPEAPTSVPATISASLSSTKPVAAAARPVNELSSEITTGMSAPPIGNTNITPEEQVPDEQPDAGPTAPRARRSARSRGPTAPRQDRRRRRCLAGCTIGRPEMSPCSFANATTLPANDDGADQAREHDRDDLRRSRRRRRATWNSAIATSAAAPPPSPLRSATICGMSVICTVRAPTSPIDRADRERPRRSAPQLRDAGERTSVAPIATSMPTPPIRLPGARVRGASRPLSPRMKQTIATR